MIRCNKCGESKEEHEFRPKNRVCKKCKNKVTKAWHEDNKEKVDAYNKANRKKRNERSKRWSIENKERYRALHKKYASKNRKKINKYKLNKYHTDEEERKKMKCRWKTSVLVKKGFLIKQPCRKCGEVRVEAHHEDYDKPEKVDWLCIKHHKALHPKKTSD